MSASSQTAIDRTFKDMKADAHKEALELAASGELKASGIWNQQQVDAEIRRRLEIQQRMLEYRFLLQLRNMEGVYRLPSEAQILIDRMEVLTPDETDRNTPEAIQKDIDTLNEMDQANPYFSRVNEFIDDWREELEELKKQKR